MRLFQCLCLFVFITCLQACKYGNEYHQVDAENKFTVSIPDWLKADKKLKPGAEFQYANRFRNFYAIGEKMPGASLNDSLQDIMFTNLDILRKSMKKPVVTDSLKVNINGLDGVEVEIYGKMNDENIYFTELLLRGKNGIYHLSVWTRAEERKLKYKDDINQILNSFKEKA